MTPIILALCALLDVEGKSRRRVVLVRAAEIYAADFALGEVDPSTDPKRDHLVGVQEATAGT